MFNICIIIRESLSYPAQMIFFVYNTVCTLSEHKDVFIF